MKLSTGLEKGVVSDDLSFASVQIDRNYWLTLPRRKKLCHKLSHDQPQPGSFFQRPREAEKRDPGNEAQNTWCMRQLLYIENCMGKSPIVKEKCVNNCLN